MGLNCFRFEKEDSEDKSNKPWQNEKNIANNNQWRKRPSKENPIHYKKTICQKKTDFRRRKKKNMGKNL